MHHPPFGQVEEIDSLTPSSPLVIVPMRSGRMRVRAKD